MNREHFVDRIARERMARLVNELVETNIREMTKKSRLDAENILRHWKERWPDCDWREVWLKQNDRRLGNE